MQRICSHCGDPFEGRPNRAYCSTSCKSAVNNQRYAARDGEARKVERVIRANRTILSKLYQLFGHQLLPEGLLAQSALNTSFNSGVAADGSRYCFLDYALLRCPNQFFQILKTVPNQ